jgi:HupE/UreJ protein
MDADHDGQLTPTEFAAAQPMLQKLACCMIEISSDGQRVAAELSAVERDESDALHFHLRFPGKTRSRLSLHASLIPKLARGHRQYLVVRDEDGELIAERVLGGIRPVVDLAFTNTATIAISPGKADPAQGLRSMTRSGSLHWTTFLDYVHEGVWHIWIGYDHILFLLSLLLPAVLQCEAARWEACANLRLALADVTQIVTAFTLAHSITLSLAALCIIALPSRWVESTIAASVIVAALNNLYPVWFGRRWIMAFLFGLVHGLGFANVLTDLGLPQGSVLLALIAFNLGVELGQLVIVGVFLPLAYPLRHSWLYRRFTLQLGSLLIAVLATIWFIERSLDLDLPGV